MLRRLVAFDTTSRNSNLALIEYVQEYLKGHGIESKLVPSEDGKKANMFATVGPMAAGGVVLSGHTDVVPVDGQPWDTDPWTLTLKDDGKYYGRGTCDMKAFYAIALAMLPQILKSPLKKPIHFALSYDEEVGCVGAHSLAAAMAREVPRPRAIIIGEPTMMTVVHAHKGAQMYVTKFTGFEAHSSMTHLGVSAVHFAGEFVHYLNTLQDQLDKEFPPTSEFTPPAPTFNVGTIVGGTAGNILARECEVLWGYRELPHRPLTMLGENALLWLKEELLPKMKAKHPSAKIETVVRSSTIGFSPEGNDEAKALAANWSGSNTVGSVVYGTEAGIFKKTLGVPTVVCGPGDIAQAHQPNEFILASQITACEG
ncbi:MAG TPA: acetylornithine deacetylase, partial [Ramlibacter sp.]